VALTVASAGQLVGNVILFFYLSRLLQPEGLGIFSTVLAIYSTVSLGCGIGLNIFLPRELPKDLSQTNRYLIHAGLVSIASALALLIGLDLLAPHLGYLPQTQTGITIMSLGLIPESLGVVLFAIFISHQKAKFITATSVSAILGRISVSLLALRLGFGVIGVIVVYAAFSYL
jgi:O-antigen/teichoic acid export membrane protein